MPLDCEYFVDLTPVASFNTNNTIFYLRFVGVRRPAVIDWSRSDRDPSLNRTEKTHTRNENPKFQMDNAHRELDF